MEQLKNRNTKSTLPILSIAIVLMLYCTGCQKEDIPVPLDASKNISTGQTSRTIPPLYTVISITHDGGYSVSAANYRVTVMSNGIAIFNGYRNVAKIGEVKFDLTEEKLLKIEELIKKYDFFSITDDLKYIPDLPYVTTTCALPQTNSVAEVADHSRSLIDYNKGYPEALIQLRKDVELLLNISSYVNVKQTGLATALPAQD